MPVDFSGRSSLLAKIMNAIDFTLSSLLNNLLVFAYLAVFREEVAPNLRYVIIGFIALRIALSFLASLTVYYGMKTELAKILA